MADPELDVVDVERAGRWTQVLLLEASSGDQARTAAQQISGTRAGMPFVGIVSADLGAEPYEILAALRPGLQEIVCFDSLTHPVVTGQDFAMAALETGGFGQDFVFTVPVLEAAVDHAVGTLQGPRHGGWEGRFVVVVGSGPVIDRARTHLTGPG